MFLGEVVVIRANPTWLLPKWRKKYEKMIMGLGQYIEFEIFMKGLLFLKSKLKKLCRKHHLHIAVFF